MSSLIFPRRRFLQGLFAAPAVIAIDRLMPVKVWTEILEPRVIVPAVNYGYYAPTWDVVKRCFTMKLNDRAPSQMFPEVEMTAREAKILADIDRVFAAQTEEDLKRVQAWNDAWLSDFPSRFV